MVEDLFRQYYHLYFDKLVLPNDLEFREIAFQPFDSASYIRHKSFSTRHELYEYIINLPPGKTPRNLFYSSARYELPAMPSMEEKGWLGSNLVFDIDSDHIPGCNSINYAICDNKLKEHHECPHAKSLRTITVIDTDCLVKAYREVVKLIDVLTNDLGLSKKSIRVNFTGNRGFHIICENMPQEYFQLTSEERREIVNYAKGNGLLFEKIFPNYRGKRVLKLVFNKDTEYGWRRRILTTIKELYPELIIGKNNKLLIIIERPMDFLNKLINSASIMIDEKVTIDISRLVRIPGSLHGKTGLVDTPISQKVLDTIFEDPFLLSPYNSQIFKLKSLVDADKFMVYGKSMQLRRGEEIVVDGGLAIFMVLNDLAELVSYKV